jgi:hypothetical protein
LVLLTRGTPAIRRRRKTKIKSAGWQSFQIGVGWRIRSIKKVGFHVAPKYGFPLQKRAFSNARH